jgi:fatty acid desaturase
MTWNLYNDLKYKIDLVSLAYLAALTALFVLHWRIGFSWILFIVSCFMTYGTGCILHNQSHKPMFRNRVYNFLVEWWILMLRGDGCHSWEATHNMNHHVYQDHEGDLTRTWRFSNKNNPVQFALYLASSSWAYSMANLRYAWTLMTGQPRRFTGIAIQILTHLSLLVTLFVIDPQKAFLVFYLPQLIGILGMVGTGYFQHTHADETSEWNHSRNFTGRLNNWMHFNHGYHTVHHEDLSLHWSEWPAAHEQIKHLIDPELNHPSLPFYLLRWALLQFISDECHIRNFRTSQKAT